MQRSFFLLTSALWSITGFSQVSVKDLSEHYEKQAQVCGGWEPIWQIKGKWKKLSDDMAFPDRSFPAGQYKQVQNRVDSMANLMKTTITDLSAMEVSWSRGMRGTSYMPMGPVPYNFQAGFFDYYCNTNLNKILLSDETNHWVYFFVNRFSWFFRDVGQWDINNDGVIRYVSQLPPKNGEWKNMHVYEPDFFAGGVTRVTTRVVVIGRKGKLPWKTLTQKQYLTGLKNDHEKQRQKMRAGSSYERDYAQKIQIIDDYLSGTSAEELAKPAIISPKFGIWGFKGVFGNEDERGFRLVLLTANENYFDKTLPRYYPQLIQVFWKYNPDNPVSLNAVKQFEENFPLDKLKLMIDK